MRKINLPKKEQHIFWKTVKDSQADKKNTKKQPRTKHKQNPKLDVLCECLLSHYL